MNKKDTEILRSYERSSTYHLSEAYGRFSNKKAEAWEYCEELCRKHDGKGLKVLGTNIHSSQQDSYSPMKRAMNALCT